MGIRRPGAKGYEEVEGVNIPTAPTSQNANGNGINNNNMDSPQFELASVSVVPDGEHWIIFGCHLLISMNAFRHVHRCAGGQCIGLRVVSSQAFAARGSLLDERLDGDDNLISSRPSFALRLAHQSISAGDGDNGRVLGHDVEQHILG